MLAGTAHLGLHLKRWWWNNLVLTRTSVLALIGLLAPAGYNVLLVQLWLDAYLSLLRAAQALASRELIKIDVAQPQQDGGAQQLALASSVYSSSRLAARWRRLRP